jgi:hypothetical protein
LSKINVSKEVIDAIFESAFGDRSKVVLTDGRRELEIRPQHTDNLLFTIDKS